MINSREAGRAASSIVWRLLLPMVLLSGCSTFRWLGPRAPEPAPIDLSGMRTAALDLALVDTTGVLELPVAALPADSAMLSTEELISFLENARAEQLGSGIASYYGRAFAGRRTASGEIFNPSELTAAHRTLPFGSRVRVTNQRNGQSIVVRINDRGPFSGRRVIDLSQAAASEIGMIRSGTAPVTLELLPDIAELREAAAAVE